MSYMKNLFPIPFQGLAPSLLEKETGISQVNDDCQWGRVPWPCRGVGDYLWYMHRRSLCISQCDQYFPGGKVQHSPLPGWVFSPLAWKLSMQHYYFGPPLLEHRDHGDSASHSPGTTGTHGKWEVSLVLLSQHNIPWSCYPVGLSSTFKSLLPAKLFRREAAMSVCINKPPTLPECLETCSLSSVSMVCQWICRFN